MHIPHREQRPAPRRLREEAQSAFSLVELMVVTAVLGILAAMILTGVHATKTKAQSANCVSNLRQHGIALNGFIGDTHEYPADGIFTERTPVQRGSWGSTLYGDAAMLAGMDRPKNDYKGVFRCSAARRPKDWPSSIGYQYYRYNSDGLFGKTPGNSLGLGKILESTGVFRPVKELEVVNPTAMVAIGDGFMGWAGFVDDGSMMLGRDVRVEFPPQGKLVSGTERRVQRRHKGRANILFCDGHVTAVPLCFLFKDTTDDALRIWNRDDQPHRERLSP